MYTYEVATSAGHVFVMGVVAPKQFSTGKSGFFGNTSSSLPKNTHLNMDATLVATIKEDGKPVAVMALKPRMFNTGSYGYHANWKMGDLGDNLVCQIQLVLKKSKGVIKSLADVKNLGALDNGYMVQCSFVDKNSGQNAVADSPVFTSFEDAVASLNK